MRRHLIHRVFSIGFLFSLNVAFTAYVNSTFLEHSLGLAAVTLTFAASALATLIVLECLPELEGHVGNRLTLLFALLAVSLGIAFLLSESLPLLIALGFICYNTGNNVVFYCLDIFLKHSMRPGETGRIRGTYLTVTNCAWLLSPLLAGVIVATYGFHLLYAATFALVTLTTVLVLLDTSPYRDAKYEHPSLVRMVRSVWRTKDIRRIIVSNFLLQFFFAWMVIFAPLYLTHVAQFSFDRLGIIFTIMLLPFVLLQYPLGHLADKGWGERRFLIAGFLVMAIATALFAGTGTHILIVYAVLLFATRVGAATVEVMNETYFFKKVGEEKPAYLSMFRAMIPLAYLLASLVAFLLLFVASYQTIFIILAILLLLGVRNAYLLHESRS